MNGGCNWTVPPDVKAGNQASFGDVSYLTRVSPHQGWYDQVVPPVVTEFAVQRLGSGSGPPTYVVPTGSTEQLKTVPIGGANAINTRFSEHVNGISPFPSDAVAIQGKTQTYVFGPTAYGYSPSDYRASYTLPVPAYPLGFTWNETLSDGTTRVHRGDALKITLKANRLVKPGSLIHLDGDFSPSPTRYWPVISSPSLSSGDGVAGTDLVFRLIILPGDFDRDNKVNLDDKAAIDANFGRTSGVTYEQGDADGDGDCDLTDFGIYKDNFGLDWSTTWPGP